jgi:hypothetical protein
MVCVSAAFVVLVARFTGRSHLSSVSPLLRL